MDKKKPIIALIPQMFPGTDNILTRPGYMTETLAAGGLPLLLPPLEEEADIRRVIHETDGLLVPGGQDVDPVLYGEERIPACGEPQPWRDRMEQTAIRAALEEGKPIFAICRGFQILNVTLGGDMYQDIPGHSMEQPTNRAWHSVRVEKDSPLYRLLGQEEIGVNSCHHQAVRRIGAGLKVMASAPDGIAEAFWMPEHPFVWGVQWHPELFYGADPNHRRLFEAFVDACRKK